MVAMRNVVSDRRFAYGFAAAVVLLTAALALPDRDGDFRRADELLLPDAALLDVLDPDEIGPDAPLSVLCSDKGKPFVYRRGRLVLAVNPAGEPATVPAPVQGMTPAFAIGGAKAEGEGIALNAQSFAVCKKE